MGHSKTSVFVKFLHKDDQYDQHCNHLDFLTSCPNHLLEYRIEHKISGQLWVYSNSPTIREAAIAVILNIDVAFFYWTSFHTKRTIC